MIRPLFTKPMAGWTLLDIDGATIPGVSYLTHPLYDIANMLLKLYTLKPNQSIGDEYIELDHEGTTSLLIVNENWVIIRNCENNTDIVRIQMNQTFLDTLTYRTIACITTNPIEWATWELSDNAEIIRKNYHNLERLANTLLSTVIPRASETYVQNVRNRLVWNRTAIDNYIKRVPEFAKINSSSR